MTRWKRLVAPALVSAGLSALFVVVYGGSNWLAGQRVDVATWYYAWERLILKTAVEVQNSSRRGHCESRCGVHFIVSVALGFAFHPLARSKAEGGGV